MKHYEDSIEFCSPVVQKVLGDPKGVVRGILVLYYKINRGLLAAEVMILGSDMKAIRVYANYDKDDVG